MKPGTVLLLLGAAWLAWRWARDRAAARVGDRLPAGVRPPSPDLRDLSPHHHDECTRALRAFAAAYADTFRGDCGRDGVLTLHELRDAALGALFELRMRLPNDLDTETRVTAHIEETDRLLRGYIADAQARCGAALLHPGPIDDLYYRQWWRAANDVVT